MVLHKSGVDAFVFEIVGGLIDAASDARTSPRLSGHGSVVLLLSAPHRTDSPLATAEDDAISGA